MTFVKDLGRKARPPKPPHPQPGQLWSITRSTGGWLYRMQVLTMETGPIVDKGVREVLCLVIECDIATWQPGSTITLTNGTFNPPNQRIA